MGPIEGSTTLTISPQPPPPPLLLPTRGRCRRRRRRRHVASSPASHPVDLCLALAYAILPLICAPSGKTVTVDVRRSQVVGIGGSDKQGII